MRAFACSSNGTWLLGSGRYTSGRRGGRTPVLCDGFRCLVHLGRLTKVLHAEGATSKRLGVARQDQPGAGGGGKDLSTACVATATAEKNSRCSVRGFSTNVRGCPGRMACEDLPRAVWLVWEQILGDIILAQSQKDDVSGTGGVMVPAVLFLQYFCRQGHGSHLFQEECALSQTGAFVHAGFCVHGSRG